MSSVRRHSACAILAVATALAAPAPAQEAPTLEPAELAAPTKAAPPIDRFDRSQLKQMEVLHRPTQDDIGPLFPPAALRDGKTGKVVVECHLNASTLLDRCKTSGEEPAGYGFAEMGVKVAGLFRVRPPTYKGEIVPGATARIPMTFSVTPPPVKTLEDREQARADGTLPAETPRESPAERRRRLGPMTRSPDVLWAPASLALLIGLGLAWALLAPASRRRGAP